MRHYIVAEKQNSLFVLKISGINITKDVHIIADNVSQIVDTPKDYLKKLALDEDLLMPMISLFTYAQAVALVDYAKELGFENIKTIDNISLMALISGKNKNTLFTINDLYYHILYLEATIKDNNNNITATDMQIIMFNVVNKFIRRQHLDAASISYFNDIDPFVWTNYGPKIKHLQKKLALYTTTPLFIFEKGKRNEFLCDYDQELCRIIDDVYAGEWSDKYTKLNIARDEKNDFIIDESSYVRFNEPTERGF